MNLHRSCFGENKVLIYNNIPHAALTDTYPWRLDAPAAEQPPTFFLDFVHCHIMDVVDQVACSIEAPASTSPCLGSPDPSEYGQIFSLSAGAVPRCDGHFKCYCGSVWKISPALTIEGKIKINWRSLYILSMKIRTASCAHGAGVIAPATTAHLAALCLPGSQPPAGQDREWRCLLALPDPRQRRLLNPFPLPGTLSCRRQSRLLLGKNGTHPVAEPVELERSSQTLIGWCSLLCLTPKSHCRTSDRVSTLT